MLEKTLASLKRLLTLLLATGMSLSAVSKEPETTCQKNLTECIDRCDNVIEKKDSLIKATGDALKICVETNSVLKAELQDKNSFWRDPAFIWPTAGAAGILLTVVLVGVAGGLSK